jgi:hypothetical protein
MPDWVGWATRVLGPIGQRALKRWLFDAEFLGGSRTVYTSERGDSPFVDIGISVRVHNRNSSPTTVHVRNIAIRLPSGIERGLERAVMIRPGPISSLDDLAEYNGFDIPGPSTRELTLHTRKYNPPDLNDYLEPSAPQIVVELGETFGNRRKLVGPLKFGGVYKQG